MNKKVLFGLVVTSLIMAGAGCYSRSTSSTTNTATVSGNAVTISNYSYSPASLTVKQGTTVTWTNNDVVDHTVTGNTGGPASGQVSPGQTYTYTFTTVGTFAYHCSNHTYMHGTVVVTP